jgi:hypothetical protein
MKCPGQDRGYWKGDCVSELPCPRCGSAVEFFKDESSRRCAQCGHRFGNPRVELDCASWCDQAEACLGSSYAHGSGLGEGDTALSGRLMRALEQELEHEPARFAWALLVFQHAKELVSVAGVNPGVVLPVALLLELEGDPSQTAGSPLPEATGRVRSQEVLFRARVDPDSVVGITGLLGSLRNRLEEDRVEVRVLEDALTLAKMTIADRPTDLRGMESLIESRLRTDAGKARARQLFLPPFNSSSPPPASRPVSENGSDA